MLLLPLLVVMAVPLLVFAFILALVFAPPPGEKKLRMDMVSAQWQWQTPVPFPSRLPPSSRRGLACLLSSPRPAEGAGVCLFVYLRSTVDAGVA